MLTSFNIEALADYTIKTLARRHRGGAHPSLMPQVAAPLNQEHLTNRDRALGWEP